MSPARRARRCFAVIALLAVGGSWISVDDAQVLTGTVLVLLYMKGPIDQMIQSLPPLVRAHASLRRVTELNDAFAASEARGVARPAAAAFQCLELRGVRYRHPAPEVGEAFAVDPLDLSVSAGGARLHRRRHGMDAASASGSGWRC